MTKEQILEDVRSELADAGITYYSKEDLFDSYDDGYEEICLETQCLERMTTIPLSNDTIYYNLYEQVIDYFRVFAIYNPANKVWLSHKSTKQLQRLRHDWELGLGNPTHFCVMDFQKIGTYPHLLNVADETLEVFYKATAKLPQSLDSQPEFEIQYQRILHNYMMQDLLAQAEEFTKAEQYLIEYLQGKNSLKIFVNNRSFADRVHILREQFSGGSFYGR